MRWKPSSGARGKVDPSAAMLAQRPVDAARCVLGVAEQLPAVDGTFAALMEAMIAEAARRGQADTSLVSVDSTVARAHHDAAGMVVDPEVLAALEEAATEEKGHRKPGKPPRCSRQRQLWRRSGPNTGSYVDATVPASRQRRSAGPVAD